MEAEFQSKSWGSGDKQEPECGGSSTPWFPPHSAAGIFNARLFKKSRTAHYIKGCICIYEYANRGCVLLKS